MKKALIVALVCINVALLAALIGMNLRTAQAQTERGGNNYLMVAGRIPDGLDAVYVVDLKTRRLAAWSFDRTAKKLRIFPPRPLGRDFPRKP